jgi:hypothetical protein
MSSHTLLSICIVSFNVRSYLERCLNSVYRTGAELEPEVLVVDNGSVDGSVEMVRERFPRVRLFTRDKNLGFAAANNVALREAGGDYLLLLNPDTECLPGSLQTLVKHLESRPECGIVGPLLLNEDDTPQNGLRRFPTPGVVFARNTFFKHLPFLRRKIDRYHMRHVNLEESRSVDQVSGAAMMFRRDTFEKVGLLDENFFIFFEEVDYCRRVREQGLDVYYLTDARIYHFGGKSRDGIKAEARWLHLESQFKYLRKVMSPGAFKVFNLFFKGAFLLSNALSAVGNILTRMIYRVRIAVNPEFRYSRKYRAQESRARFLRYLFLKKLKIFLFRV